MARTHSSFTRKLDTHMDAVIGRAYEDLENLEACAGIKGNSSAAFKAKINHYGHFTRGGGWAPPRPVISRATTGSDNVKRMAQLIKSRIVEGKAETRTFVSRRTASGAMALQEQRSRSQPFYIAGTHNTPLTIMRAIANEMAENQRKSITGWELKRNKKSTIERKGQGKPPMFDKGEVLQSIEAWVNG